MEKKSIGDFIAILRKANGMTQQEMADKLNISNKAISRWERSECMPDISLIPVIAEMFNVTCDELLRGERITDSLSEEKAVPKVEKQMKMLLKRALYRFTSSVLIAVVASFIGFIVQFAIAYGFYKPIIGFTVMVVFVLASSTCILLSLSKLNSQVEDNELFEHLSSQEIKGFKKARYYYSFLSLFINMIIIIWSLPLVIVIDSYYIDSVMLFREYIMLVPYFILITTICYLVANGVCMHFLGIKKYCFALSRNIIILNVLQLVCPLLVIAFGYGLMSIGGHIGGILSIILFAALVSAVIVPFIYYAVEDKKDNKLVIAVGLRNIGLWGAFLIFESSVSYSTSYDWNNKITEVYFDSKGLINVANLLTMLIIGYVLLKKYWVQSNDINFGGMD